MADTDVLIKIAADIGSATAALNQMVAIMGELAASMTAVGQGSQTVSTETQKATVAVDALSVAMGTQLSKAFDTAVEGVKGLVTGFPQMVTEAAKAGEEMQTMANRLGLSVEAVDQMMFVADQANVPFQVLARSAQTFGTSVMDSSSKAAESMKSMGIAIDQSNPSAAFDAWLKGLSAIPDKAQAAAEMTKVLGARAQSLTPLLSENIDELQKEAKALGLTEGALKTLTTEGDKYYDNLGKIERAQDTFKQSLAAAVLPAVNAVAGAMPNLGGAILTVGETMMDAAGKALPLLGNLAALGGKEGIGGVVKAFDKFKPAVSGAIASFGGWVKGANDATKASGGFTAALGQVGPKLTQLGTSILTMTKTMAVGFVTAIKTSIVALYEMAAAALANPYVLLAVALVALGAAVYKLIGGWEGLMKVLSTVGQVFTDLWRIIKVGFTAFMDQMKKGDAATTAFGLAVKALTFPIMAVWKLLEKLVKGLGWFFNTAAEALHEYADSVDEAGRAAEDLPPPPAVPPAVQTSWEDLAFTLDSVTKAYDEVLLKNKDEIEAWQSQGATTGEILVLLKERYEALGLSAEIVARAMEKFLKTQAEAAKAPAATPLSQFTDSLKKLTEEMRRAPLAEQMEEFGKRAADAVKQAERLGLSLKAMPADVKAVGDAWTASQLEIKAKAFADEIEAIREDFHALASGIADTWTDAINASDDALKNLRDDAIESALEGTEQRLFQIDREEKRELLAIQRTTQARQTQLKNDIGALRAGGDREIAATIAAGKEVTAAQRAEIEKRVADAIAEAERLYGVFKEGQDKQVVAIKAAGVQKREAANVVVDELVALEEELTAETMTEVERRAYFLKKDEEYRIQQIRDRYGAQVEAAEKEIDLVRRIYAERRKMDAGYTGNLKREMERRGQLTKSEQQAQIDIEVKHLEEMEKQRADGTAEISDKTLQDQRDRIRQMEEEAKAVESMWMGVIDNIAMRMGQIGSMVGGTTGQTMMQLAGTVQGIQANMRFGKDQMGVFQSKGATAGDKAQAGINMGMAVAGGVMEVKAAVDQRKKSQRVVGGAMAGAKAGAAFGPYGAAVGAGVGALIGALHEPKWVKAANEVGRDWGVEISDGLGKQLQEDAKTKFKGDRMAASVFNIGDIVGEAGGLKDDNIDKMTEKLRDVFSMMETGKFTVEQTRETLDKNFGAFAAHVANSGKIASKAFTDIIKLNAEMQVGSKEVTDFVQGQTQRLGGAVATLMAPFTKNVETLTKSREAAQQLKEQIAKEGQGQQEGAEPSEKTKELTKELDKLNVTIAATEKQLGGSAEAMARFERITLAGFNAALAAGVGYLEALDGIGPALDQMAEAHKKLGTTGGAAIQELMHFREVAAANSELVESAGALNEVMLALSNIGALNTETFADMQVQGQTTYDQLIAAGFSQTQALQQMKGYLEGVRDAHKELGLPIDENTAALLAQAEAQGVVKAESMSTNDIMLQGLGAIIEALGGELPEAFKKMAAAAHESATAVAASMETEVVGAIEETASVLTGELPEAFQEMAVAADEAAMLVAQSMMSEVGGSLDATSAKIAGAPWSTYAAKGVAAGDLTARSVGAVEGSIDNVAAGLENTDWESWASAAVDAAGAAQAAVDAVSFGSSPGGIKEIPLKLMEAIKAFEKWEKEGVSSAEAVKDSVDAVSESPAAVTSMNNSMKDNAGALAAMQAAMGGGGDEVTVNITSFDTQGMEQAVESRVIPAMVKALRKGGRGLTDIQGVLR